MQAMDLFVAPGQDKQATEAGDATRQEFYKIQGGFIGPMDVFEHDKGGSHQLIEPMEEFGEERDAIVGTGSFPIVAPDLPDNVIERGQRPGCEQGVAGPLVHCGVVAVFLGECPDKRGFTKTGFAADHDAMPLPCRHVFEFVMQRGEWSVSFDQVDVHRLQFGYAKMHKNLDRAAII